MRWVEEASLQPQWIEPILGDSAPVHRQCSSPPLGLDRRLVYHVRHQPCFKLREGIVLTFVARAFPILLTCALVIGACSDDSDTNNASGDAGGLTEDASSGSDASVDGTSDGGADSGSIRRPDGSCAEPYVAATVNGTEGCFETCDAASDCSGDSAACNGGVCIVECTDDSDCAAPASCPVEICVIR